MINILNSYASAIDIGLVRLKRLEHHDLSRVQITLECFQCGRSWRRTWTIGNLTPILATTLLPEGRVPFHHEDGWSTVCEWFIDLPRAVWGLFLSFLSSARTAWDGILGRINVRAGPDSGVACEGKFREDVKLEQRHRAAGFLAFTLWFLQQLFFMTHLPIFLPAQRFLSPQHSKGCLKLEETNNKCRLKVVVECHQFVTLGSSYSSHNHHFRRDSLHP